MPLSKARDKERKRIARLEKMGVPTQTPKVVQPDELRAMIKRMESTNYTTGVDKAVGRDYSVELDADGNVIPSV